MSNLPLQGSVSAEEHQILLRKYNKLNDLYAELLAEHAKCTARIKRADVKYAAAKESARSWKEYLEKSRLLPPKRVSHSGPTSANQRSPARSDVKRITSSQTTEGDPNDAEPLPPESATHDEYDDEPEIVSVRMVKRARRVPADDMPPPVKIKLEVASPSDPVVLDLANCSSPIPPQQRAVRMEPSDLDLHCDALHTPRKRKRERAVSEEFARPATLLATTSSLSEGGLPGMIEDAAYVKAEGEDAMHDPLVETTNSSFGNLQRPQINKVLSQRSVNIPGAPNGNARSGLPRKRKRKRDTVQTSARLLSEDGDQDASQVVSNIRANISSDHRLDGLLDEALSERQPLPKRSAPESKPVQRGKAIPSPAIPHTPTTNSPKHNPRTVRRPRNPQPPSNSKHREPLRQRPLASLRIEDFKINPAYQDSDYAFAQTVRTKEHRRCLPGCTRPDCCGAAFKRAIELNGPLEKSKSDSQVLEEYLGPDFATLMGAYGPERRKEVVLDAHAFLFANEHGKHRNAFERAPTPPGFWRTDMPTTQEEQQDREAAVLLERRKVEARWREAMRGDAGGRWLFRDE